MSDLRHVKHFGALIDSECKVLILGSVPSVKSVEQGFFYMHPQNRFWKVLGNLLGQNLYDASIDERRKVLLKNHIALYDAITECDIVGSDDSKITNIVPSDLNKLIGDSKIKHIFCTGNKSYKTTIKYNEELSDIITPLPSTSPANAKQSLEMLESEYKIILKYL